MVNCHYRRKVEFRDVEISSKLSLSLENFVLCLGDDNKKTYHEKIGQV